MTAETTARRAMLAVAAHAHDAAECRELLGMLGIIPQKSKRRPGRPSANCGHGDHRAYQKGCRCDDCRNAYRLYAASLRAKWQDDPTSADRAGHGKASTYRNHGCRCTKCTEANRADCAARRDRRRERAALTETGGA